MKRSIEGKYRPYPPVDLSDRTWPSRAITQAPQWCTVDLRDGNQALVTPMNLDKKLELFDLLLRLGFKQIEIGFPSASKVEYDFLRTLIERRLIPDDVTVQVLVQAREHLIDKTFDALYGAKRAIVHLYNSTSTAQRKIVFRKEKQEIIDLALEGVDMIKARAAEFEGEILLEYSPESFTGTELEFAAEICNAVTARWGISAGRPVIINLPATVEMATPNVYADQIEWMARNLDNREHVLISTHTHNDRGTAVAATELALMAGADRVEGTLLGNGERTGNVDIVTLALNMYTQGVDPELDLTDVNHMLDVVERCTQIKTHVRHPYVGELVYTAFSGSHQDAINKGMAHQRKKEDPFWEVPYLPIDPEDVGRTYESIIRINSQSGKGGVAYILDEKFGYQLPKKMHPEVGRLVQRVTDREGRELTPDEILDIFETSYFRPVQHLEFIDMAIHSTTTKDKSVRCQLTYRFDGTEYIDEAVGNGPIDACRKALKLHYPHKFILNSYAEHSMGAKSTAQAVAYIEIETESLESHFGVGRDTDIALASVQALFSAVNRAFAAL